MITRRRFLGGVATLTAAPLLPRSSAAASSAAPRLKTLLGDYPNTAALKNGRLSSPLVDFDFVEIKPVHAGFKRTVRDLEFDISELSVVTFLQAKAAGVPLVLIPTVMFSRFQHPYIVYNAERGTLTPSDLPGKRVACRLYTATTATWLRGILASDYGVDPASVHWLAFEKPNVAGYRDPANVQPAPEGADLVGLLLAGEVDAIIIEPLPQDPRVRTLIANPTAAATSWQARHQAIQINHMVVAKQSLTRSNPEAVREFYRLLSESKRLAAKPEGNDPTPYGVEANRRNLGVAIDMVYRQGMIPRRFGVDELFDDVTRSLI